MLTPNINKPVGRATLFPFFPSKRWTAGALSSAASPSAPCVKRYFPVQLQSKRDPKRLPAVKGCYMRYSRFIWRGSPTSEPMRRLWKPPMIFAIKTLPCGWGWGWGQSNLKAVASSAAKCCTLSHTSLIFLKESDTGISLSLHVSSIPSCIVATQFLSASHTCALIGLPVGNLVMMWSGSMLCLHPPAPLSLAWRKLRWLCASMVK